MVPQEVHDRLKAQPFEPFVLITSDQGRHEVRHPELAIPVKGGRLYLFAPAHDDGSVMASPTVVSLLHVTTIHPHDASAA
ncbi:MAG: hypothetical protein AAF823_12850 [Planctomycetota bacterium]